MPVSIIVEEIINQGIAIGVHAARFYNIGQPIIVTVEIVVISNPSAVGV